MDILWQLTKSKWHILDVYISLYWKGGTEEVEKHHPFGLNEQLFEEGMKPVYLIASLGN